MTLLLILLLYIALFGVAAIGALLAFAVADVLGWPKIPVDDEELW
jgi:phosphotransferase system  glucose/maltose/N-acetylglucosamine-specific IIC component